VLPVLVCALVAGGADPDSVELLAQDIGAMARRGHELGMDRPRIAMAHREVLAPRPVAQAPVGRFVTVMGELPVGTQHFRTRLGSRLQGGVLAKRRNVRVGPRRVHE
jgi:hypothetical protein